MKNTTNLCYQNLVFVTIDLHIFKHKVMLVIKQNDLTKYLMAKNLLAECQGKYIAKL